MKKHHLHLLYLLTSVLSLFNDTLYAQIALGIHDGTTEGRAITISATTTSSYIGNGFSGLFFVIRYPAAGGPVTPTDILGFNQVPPTLVLVDMGVSGGYQYMFFENNTAAGPLAAPWGAGNTFNIMSFNLSGGIGSAVVELAPDGDPFADAFLNAYYSDPTAASQIYGSDVIINGVPTVTAYTSNMTTNPVSLPIELVRFEPRFDRCDAFLYWETASEQNFAYYEIEASKDGRTFAPVGQVKPASPNNYTLQGYKHAIRQQYHNYYFRLKSIDLDGAFSYSKIVFVEAPCLKEYAAQLYPNPNYTPTLTVEINSLEKEDNVLLQVLDALGRVCFTQKTSLENGVNKIFLDTHELPSGNYYVKIIGTKQVEQSLRFIRSTF